MKKLLLLLLLSAGVQAQKIKPIQIGINKTADSISVTVLSFKSNAKYCSVYYEVYSTDKKRIDEGNLHLSESEFKAWKNSSTYLDDLVLAKLGLTRK